MSRTTLYRVYKTSARPIAEFGNSWGSAPALWNVLWGRYVDPTVTVFPIWESDLSRLWKCAERKDIPEHLRLALAFTFDFGIVKPADVSRMSYALRKTADDCADWRAYPENQPWSHWAGIADALGGDRSRDKRVLGYGLGCTSVSDEWESWPRESERSFNVMEVRDASNV